MHKLKVTILNLLKNKTAVDDKQGNILEERGFS